MSPGDLKEKLSKCGKLEELKTQLTKMKETKAKLKTPLPKPKSAEPKLEQFDKLTVEVETARCVLIEPRRVKTGFRGFRPGPTQTRLYNHRRWLEA